MIDDWYDLMPYVGGGMQTFIYLWLVFGLLLGGGLKWIKKYSV